MLRGGDPVLDDLLELLRGHARVRGHDQFQHRMVAAGECAVFKSPLSSEANGSLVFHSGCCGASVFTRSKAKNDCTGSGCSHQSVPSLSKVAIRFGSGTKSGEPSFVTFATKSTMAFFASAVVPRGQWVLCVSDGASNNERKRGQGGEDQFYSLRLHIGSSFGRMFSVRYNYEMLQEEVEAMITAYRQDKENAVRGMEQKN